MCPMGIDRHVLAYMAAHRALVLTFLARGLMAVGLSRIVWAVAALGGAVFVVQTRQWRLAVAAGIALIGAYVSAEALKRVIARPRPPASVSLVHLRGWSMPSTQAALTAALVLGVLLAFDWDRWPAAIRLRRAAVALLAGGVGLVGLAMVYLGGHWPSDVVAGWGLGAAVGLAAAWTAGAVPLPAALRRS